MIKVSPKKQMSDCKLKELSHLCAASSSQEVLNLEIFSAS